MFALIEISVGLIIGAWLGLFGRLQAVRKNNGNSSRRVWVRASEPKDIYRGEARPES